MYFKIRAEFLPDVRYCEAVVSKNVVEWQSRDVLLRYFLQAEDASLATSNFAKDPHTGTHIVSNA